MSKKKKKFKTGCQQILKSEQHPLRKPLPSQMGLRPWRRVSPGLTVITTQQGTRETDLRPLPPHSQPLVRIITARSRGLTFSEVKHRDLGLGEENIIKLLVIF